MTLNEFDNMLLLRNEAIVVLEDFYADDFWTCLYEGGNAEEFFESHEVVITIGKYLDYKIETTLNRELASSEIKHICFVGGYIVVFVETEWRCVQKDAAEREAG